MSKSKWPVLILDKELNSLRSKEKILETLELILKDGYSIVPHEKNEIALFRETHTTKTSYPCKNIKQLIKVYMKLKANKDG